MIGGLVIDNFAGGGGASTGIEAAIGRSIDVAINHDGEALAMHSANHPATHHLCQSVWQADPLDVTGGRPVALAWFSPDCKHFSKAKGGKPVKKNIRDLAWVVVHWAQRVRPRVIMLENVEEFRDWGPLIEVEGGKLMPCPARKGLTYRRWKKALQKLGYKIAERELRACDYGAPTIRKRLFVIARRDGLPIVWPAPTHGPAAALPWRTAAECIDWSIPCPSIFGRKKPLAENTLRRIAAGIRRYVIEADEPFIVPRYGERDGQAPRTSSVHSPFHTVTPDANVGSLVVPLIARIGQTGGGGKYANGIEEPLTTITTKGEHLLVAPHITKFRGGAIGSAADKPMPTVTANSFIKRPGGAPPLGVVAAFLAKHYGGHETPGWPLDRPISTLTTQDHHHVVAAHLLSLKGSDRRAGPADAPSPSITAQGGHVAEVRAFLLKYYGSDQDPRLDAPLHSVTTKDRFGLVMVHGESYEIVDIGMRMLSPRELFRAQGFPDSYVIDCARPVDGKPLTKTSQVRMCGNSVCPPIAEALVRANLVEMAEQVAA